MNRVSLLAASAAMGLARGNSFRLDESAAPSSPFLRGYLLTAHDTFSKEKVSVGIGDRFVRIGLKTD